MIYFEARNQPDIGQVAVAYSAINRVEDSRFKNSLCDVITDGCHYSFYCDGKSDVPTNAKAYNRALIIAGLTFFRILQDPTDGATHYHADYVYPWWASKLEYVGKIQNHLFYKS